MYILMHALVFQHQNETCAPFQTETQTMELEGVISCSGQVPDLTVRGAGWQGMPWNTHAPQSTYNLTAVAVS